MNWPRERLNELSHSIFASQLFPEWGELDAQIAEAILRTLWNAEKLASHHLCKDL
jgi:hypothetical protein